MKSVTPHIVTGLERVKADSRKQVLCKISDRTMAIKKLKWKRKTHKKEIGTNPQIKNL
jgi:hypothetical protein